MSESKRDRTKQTPAAATSVTRTNTTHRTVARQIRSLSAPIVKVTSLNGKQRAFYFVFPHLFFRRLPNVSSGVWDLEQRSKQPGTNTPRITASPRTRKPRIGSANKGRKNNNKHTIQAAFFIM